MMNDIICKILTDKGSKYTKLRDIGLCAFIFIFAVLLYANTFHHGWVMDDDPLFRKNRFVTAGLSGVKDIMMNHSISGMFDNIETFQYRPVSQLLFALEWEVSPDNTTFYHVMNVFWGAMCCVLLFIFLRMIFKSKMWIYPLLITLIFTANPMHTEVVANIKSRDELCYFLFLLLAIIFALKYFENGRKINLLWMFLTYTLSFFSKESAITALVAIPLVVFFFGERKNIETVKPTVKQKGKKPEKKENVFFRELKPYFIIVCVLLLSAGVYLGMRYAVLSVWHDYHSSYVTLMQNYLADQSLDIRLGSAVWLMGKYLLLAFVPYMQSCDYSFAELPYVGLLDWRFLLVFVLYAAALVYVVRSVFVKKEKSVFAFCILFWVTTMSIYSNTVYLIGSSFADRFLFVPVLASAMAFVELLTKLLKLDMLEVGKGAKSMAMIAVCLVVVCLFSTKTVLRAAEWKDSYTLFSVDAPKVPNSVRMKYFLSCAILERAAMVEYEDSAEYCDNIRRTIGICNEAIAINPNYGECYERLGYCYLRLNNYYPDMHFDDSSAYYLDKSIELSYNIWAFYNRAQIAYNNNDYLNAKEYFSEIINYRTLFSDLYIKIADSFYALGIYDTAITYLTMEIDLDSTQPKVYHNLGCCYSELSKIDTYGDDERSRFMDESMKMYDKAIEKDPYYYPAYSSKMLSLVALGKWNDVLTLGLKAIEVDTAQYEGYFYAGVAYCQLDKNEEAEQYFDKALELNPNDYATYLNLAYIYRSRGEIQKADLMQRRGEQLQQNSEVR